MNVKMIKEKANEILKSKESECSYIEYKKSADQLDKILKTVCAYGNNYYLNDAQFIFIGVEEENDADNKAIPKLPIFGVKEEKLEIEASKIKSLSSYLSPNVRFEVITNELDGRKYLLVVVLKQNGGPFATIEKDKKIRLKQGRYIRTDFESRLCKINEEFELIKKFANYSFEEEINEDASIDDLNYEYLKEFVRLSSDREINGALSKEEICQLLNLLDKNDPACKKVKNYAVLMFAENPERFIKNAYTELIADEYNDKATMESKRFCGPIWKQYSNVVNYIKNNFLNAITVRTENEALSKEISNFPFTAIEELVANAIVHNDYQNEKSIQVYITNSFINIVNYNSPLPPISVDDLNERKYFNERNFINPAIRDMFKKLHIIESFGTGIGEAKRSLEANGSPTLFYKKFKDDSPITSVVIPVNERYNEIKVGVEPNKKVGIEDKINQVILNSGNSNLVKNNILKIYGSVKTGVFGNIDIQKILDCSENNATKYIKRIAELKIAKPVVGLGKGKYKFILD